jgi:hypothetical protein
MAAISCLLLFPAPVHAGPDFAPQTGVDFFPLTGNQWKRNALGVERRVEAHVARLSGRPEVRWRVVFVSANDRDSFAETTGVLELSRERAECQSPQLFVEEKPRRYLVREYRSYAAISEEPQRLYPGAGSPFFNEKSRAGLVPKPFPFVSRFCDEIRNQCAQWGGGWLRSGILPGLNSNLAIGVHPPRMEIDCGRLDAEEARCRETSQELDRAWAAALEERRQQLELAWSCAALVHVTFEDDGSVGIVASGRDDFSWGSARVEPPWLAIRPSAWVFAPATVVGDVGVMSAQALRTAFWLMMFELSR